MHAYLKLFAATIVLIAPFPSSFVVSVHVRSHQRLILFSSHNSGDSHLITTNGRFDRRQHKNKYQSFSTDIKDPLKEAIIQQETIAKEKIQTQVFSGTTVPTKPLRKTNMTSRLQLVDSERKALDSSVESSVNVIAANAINIKKIEPSDPYTFGYVEIGTIVKAHGVRGELKLQATADNISDLNLKTGSVVYIKRPNRRTPRPIAINNVIFLTGDSYMLSFELIKTRTMAEKLRDYIVYIRKSDQAKLRDDEYMIRDIVGMNCYLFDPNFHSSRDCSSHENHGNIDSTNAAVYIQYADPIAVVEGVVPPDELCGREIAKLMHAMVELKLLCSKELCLVPLVPAIVRIVDVNNQVMVIDPPNGLLDMTYQDTRRVIIRGFLGSAAESVSDVKRYELTLRSISIRELPPLVPT